MSRFLFLSIPEKGHLNPMIGPAAHLRDRGHTVAFYAEGNVCDQLRRARLAWVPEMEAYPVPTHNRGSEFAARVRDPVWLREWIGLLLVDQAEGRVKPIRDVIHRFQPDVIVTDPMIYAGIIAAHEESTRWVALSNSLNPVLHEDLRSDLLETVAWLAPKRAEFFKRHGLKTQFRGCDALSPWLTIAFTTEEFVGYAVPGVHMVGPSFPPEARGDETEFPWQRLRPDLPLVYVSFGSQIYHQPAFFRLLAEASKDLDIQLVIAAQQLQDSPELGALPSHVIACSYAPQLALLPRCRVFVTHGGANSLMEAIRFGVPVLISPICNDQYHQAHYVRSSGIGEVVDLSSVTIEQCRQLLVDLLNAPQYREAMSRVSASYQRDGAREAARLIEGLT